MPLAVGGFSPFLGVLFLCQKIQKTLFSLCFFLGKGILAPTTPPAPPAQSGNYHPGPLLWSLRARGNFDKQFGSLLNKRIRDSSNSE